MGKTSKVIVHGQKGCGKTAILEQLIYGNFLANTIPTIEDVYAANIESDKGIREQMRLYDFAGLAPKTREVPKHHLAIADAFVLVYSVDDKESFQMLDYLKKDIDKNKEKKELVIIILGNKKDNETGRQVEASVAQAWATKEKVRLYEVSAMDRKSLYEPFVYLTSKLNLPPVKTTFLQNQLGWKPKPGSASGDA